jgi:hypothetical protein
VKVIQNYVIVLNFVEKKSIKKIRKHIELQSQENYVDKND